MFEIDLSDKLFLFGRGPHVKMAAPGAEIYLAVGDIGRGPGFTFDVIRPKRLPTCRREAVHATPAVRDEYQSIMDCRGGHHMFLQCVGPNLARRRHVCLSYINTLEPRLILAPKNVTAARDINTIVIEDGHAENIARPFAAIQVVTVYFGLGRTRIGIELKHLLELCDGTSRSSRAFEWLKAIEDSISPTKKEDWLSVHDAE